MIKNIQKQFYTEIGRRLTQEMKHRKITISQLARKSGQQFNTVEAVLRGHHFYFHQVIWIMDYLKVSIDNVVSETNHQLFKDTFYGKEKDESKKEIKEEIQESCESFI